MLNLTSTEKRGVKLAFRELLENRRDLFQMFLLTKENKGDFALCPMEVGLGKEDCQGTNCVECWRLALHLKEDDQEGYT